MLHLAFTERALLADEMGLGKILADLLEDYETKIIIFSDRRRWIERRYGFDRRLLTSIWPTSRFSKTILTDSFKP